MSDDRTYGETKDCRGCRYWSEMLAQAGGGIVGVQAMCISPDSPERMKYKNGRSTCDKWQSGHLGAVDEPGQDPNAYDGEI